MAKTAKKTDPRLWARVKRKVAASDKGGREGRWSARKAQMAVQDFQREGGGYVGAKPKETALEEWSEGGGRKQRAMAAKGPRGARKAAKKSSKKAGSKAALKPVRKASGKSPARGAMGRKAGAAKGRATPKRGRAGAREPGRRGPGRPPIEGPTKQDLLVEARKRGIPGRSKMNKAQLERALKK